uniref:Uncharacterized protein n=1 Tax=Arundo donax TaxID=35708 RepID=A0A0A8Y7P4_ARUDO
MPSLAMSETGSSAFIAGSGADGTGSAYGAAGAAGRSLGAAVAAVRGRGTAGAAGRGLDTAGAAGSSLGAASADGAGSGDGMVGAAWWFVVPGAAGRGLGAADSGELRNDDDGVPDVEVFFPTDGRGRGGSRSARGPRLLGHGRGAGGGRGTGGGRGAGVGRDAGVQGRGADVQGYCGGDGTGADGKARSDRPSAARSHANQRTAYKPLRANSSGFAEDDAATADEFDVELTGFRVLPCFNCALFPFLFY